MKKTLAQIAAQVEAVASQIDQVDDEIPESLIAQLADGEDELASKVDSWISYLDYIRATSAMYRERVERAAKGQKVHENLEKRLKLYLKKVIQDNPGLKFKGDDGEIYLHRNAPALKTIFDSAPDRKVTLSSVVQPDEITLLAPDSAEYLKSMVYHVLDRERIKSDLAAGKTVTFATIQQDSHVRIK